MIDIKALKKANQEKSHFKGRLKFQVSASYLNKQPIKTMRKPKVRNGIHIVLGMRLCELGPRRQHWFTAILTSPRAKKNSALIDKEARHMHQ